MSDQEPIKERETWPLFAEAYRVTVRRLEAARPNQLMADELRSGVSRPVTATKH
jgi:hypothetical protein